MEQEIKKRIINTSNPMFHRAKSEMMAGLHNLLAQRKYREQVGTSHQRTPMRQRNISVNEQKLTNENSDLDSSTGDPILNLPHMCMQVKQKQNLEKLLKVSK